MYEKARLFFRCFREVSHVTGTLEVITIYGILCLLLQGGITYGACTVHGRAGPPHGVPRFDQSHARRISAVGAALRGRVPSPYGGVAPRWEAPDGPPFQRVPELSLTDP